MISEPFFAPNSKHVVATAERGGRQVVVVDGKVWKETFDRLWEPIFDADGERLLVRGVADGKVVRHVVPVSQILR
jgi:hypothetical protein